MGGYTSLKIKGSAGVPISATVATFADLPLASDKPLEYFIVTTSTGVWFVNRREAGLYVSNGVAWTRLGNWDLAFRSDNFGVYDVADANKIVGIDPSATTQKRMIAMPDYNVNLADFYNQNDLTKEPTGFTDNTDKYNKNIAVTYNSVDRTVTLTGDFVASYHGRNVISLVSGYTSPPHNAGITGTVYLTYNGTDIAWRTFLDISDIQIAFVVANASGPLWCNRETHNVLDFRAHANFHNSVGTSRVSGGSLSNYTLLSTTPAQRRLDISETELSDEDLRSTLPLLLGTSGYTSAYLTGAGVSTFETDKLDFIRFNPANNRPYYNRLNAGTWVQTEVSNNNYVNYFLMAIPTTADIQSSKYRYIFVQGQQAGNLTVVDSETTASLNLGGVAATAPEFVFIAKITVLRVADNWSIASVKQISGSKYSQVAIGGTIGSTTIATTGNLVTGDGSPSNPVRGLNRDGFFDYSHSGTTQSYTTGSLKLLNDTLGPYTTRAYAPLNVTDVWNSTTNQFDFSQLSLGDEVTIRTDCVVTTTSLNQVFGTKLNMSIGTNPYSIELGQSFFKAVGTYPVTRLAVFYVGNTDTLNNPAELVFSSDAAATLQMNGFYVSIKRRNV